MKKITAIIRFLASVHFTAIAGTTIFRLIFLLVNRSQYENVEDKTRLIFTALERGFEFDNVVGCFILALPALLLVSLALANRIYPKLIRAVNIYLIFAYTFIFMISAADVPYFSYFFSHLNASVFNWADQGGTAAAMIFKEPSYYFYFALYLVVITGFAFCAKLYRRILLRTETTNIKGREYFIYSFVALLFFGLCFLGMRGGARHHPMRVSRSFICPNPFLNQVGVNPAFYFLKKGGFGNTNNEETDAYRLQAYEYVREAMGADPDAAPTIARRVVTQGEPLNANVVVVLMESMAREFLMMKNGDKSLTPNLHELISKSYYFENFYSSGIHSNNGVVSSLYGYPAYYKELSMGWLTPVHFMGLPVTLQKKGYKTMFIMTHDPYFDNMNAFLYENGVEQTYSKGDFPEDKIVNTWGVADDYLFEFALDKIDRLAVEGKPFQTTILTMSNHPPFTVPDKYKHIKGDPRIVLAGFADEAIGQFMAEASKREWYNNTIFVFVADHGAIVGEQLYPMAISLNRVPLIIHSPLLKDAPRVFRKPGIQIDIFPTVMGLLNQPYVNSSMGVDLLKQDRKYAYFVSDTQLAVVDDDYLYIHDKSEDVDYMYRYSDKSTENVVGQMREKADSMKLFGMSMIHGSEYLLDNKLATFEAIAKISVSDSVAVVK